jgi:putative ABC transport system ATP-binding protein
MIETRNLKKSFKNGDVTTEVLKGIDLKVESGEFVSIMGRSGAGKSTLLYQISLLDEPTGGEVIIDGRDTHTMTMSEKIPFRLTHFGYVFQDYALLPDLTAVENVALPLLMQGLPKAEAYKCAIKTLTELSLEHRLNNLPSNMSGGEQQRVSIARAVAHSPKILFADEPTANLDNDSSKTIMGIFKDLHKAGQTIIMITHEEQFAKVAQKIIKIDDGRIVSTVSTGNN